MCNRLSLDECFIKIACIFSNRTACLKRKVGAIIINKYNHIISTGYNGPPKNYKHCKVCLRSVPNKLKDCPSVHAEMNAILQCYNIKEACTMYVTTYPCLNCAKIIANTNIKNIIYLNEYNTTPENLELTKKLFNVTKIKVRKYK